MTNRKPNWLSKRIDFKKMRLTESKLKGLNLHTVCRQASCPNRSECYDEGVVTFLIMGKLCTRDCTFCDVNHGLPQELDSSEPERLAEAVRRLESRFVVITSVTRDDLPDGGAAHFASCVEAVKSVRNDIGVEVLVPDMHGEPANVKTVLTSLPDIFAHNVETVPRLYSIRKGADYVRSLEVLKFAKKWGAYTKSAVMLGLGETESEVISVLSDLREVGCDFISIGQYLAPDYNHYPVSEYILPEKFEEYRQYALELGFLQVESGPYVRSSYHAHHNMNIIKGKHYV